MPSGLTGSNRLQRRLPVFAGANTCVGQRVTGARKLAARPLVWHNACVRAKGNDHLSKDDLIDIQGTVVAVHSGGLYRVQSDAGHEVLAQLSGRMRRFRIKVVPGDRVTVGVSPYDPVRGIITFRAR